MTAMCETPKSPPGDYNADILSIAESTSRRGRRVKHLNPRQGITTPVLYDKDDGFGYVDV